jgi:ATP-dependent Clp protease ATP-binding subunit ClpC
MPLRRLNDDGRAVVNFANQIAHEQGLEYVGTEHILLAILRHNNCLGARVLHKLGVKEETVLTTLKKLLQRAKEDTWVFGRLPGSPNYRDVIERAMEISDQLEAQTIGSEHLLLALFHNEENVAQQALTTLGVTPSKCRAEVLRQLSNAS